MRLKVLSLLLAFVGLASACTSPPAVPPKAASPAPSASSAPPAEAPKPAFDFDALLKREVPALAVKKLTNAVLSADVEAAADPVVTNEKGAIHVVFPVGTVANVECWVYDEAKDPAATLSAMIDAIKKGGLDVRLFAPTDVFLAGQHGAIAAHAIYLMDHEGAKAAGELKLVFYNHPLVPAMCMHDEAGYSASFTRITKRFFETARRSDRELRGKPRSWQVSVVKLDGRPVGALDDRGYEHKDTHVTTSVAFSSSLYPRSAVACMPEDSVTSRTFDASGALLESSHTKASAGEVQLNVDLKRLGPGRYSYNGKKSGKPFSGKFATTDKRGVATDDSIAADIKRLLLTGKSASFETEEYSPEVDPTASFKTLYEMDSKEERRIRVSFGPIKLVAVVDTEGHAEKATGNIGSAALTVERLGGGKL